MRKCKAEFTKEFIAAREELVHEKSQEGTNGTCMDELLPEHILGLNLWIFVHITLGFADDLLKQRINPKHLPAVTEISVISSLRDTEVIVDDMAQACHCERGLDPGPFVSE